MQEAYLGAGEGTEDLDALVPDDPTVEIEARR